MRNATLVESNRRLELLVNAGVFYVLGFVARVGNLNDPGRDEVSLELGRRLVDAWRLAAAATQLRGLGVELLAVGGSGS